MAKPKKEILVLDGHEVTVSNPEKIYFPRANVTKLELVEYYLSIAEGALRGTARRPMILKRFSRSRIATTRRASPMRRGRRTTRRATTRHRASARHARRASRSRRSR